MATEIESHLQESRVFAPPGEFARGAHVSSLTDYQRLCRRAHEQPEEFWSAQALRLDWSQPWHTWFEKTSPFVRFFVGGKLNLAQNCLDRHLATHASKIALYWEGEPGDRRQLTYQELHDEVCRAANALASLGVRTGDRVALYLPMIPELAVAMLACARLGATHSVIFGGFSSEAIGDRVRDQTAKIIVTADGGWRRGKIVVLKENIDAALAGNRCPSVEHVLVVRRTGQEISMQTERDMEWAPLVAAQSTASTPVAVDAEHPLFILYTSGTTGKPKGVVHSTGGYGVQVAYTTQLVFDLKDDDIYWCTADVGWITGHSYVVYGPLLNGATTLMYEGAPDAPERDRFWSIIERYRVSIFYTAPTAIRTFMRWGDSHPAAHDLSSLRLLGSVGEPINPEAWMWYREKIGGNRCPIVDTWWQTETGAILLSPIPGATPTKPGSCTLPLPGIDIDVVNAQGQPCPPNTGGYLVVRRPWPSMLRTVWGDPDRYVSTYFSTIRVGDRPYYFAGDGARRDSDGYFWVMGRIDDVINVSGHRLGTMEIESALVSHPSVAEAAVVGRPDEIKGQAVAAFVTLRSGFEKDDAMKKTLASHVVSEIGALARPDEIRFTDALPKTRSGKIMRRFLRDVASGAQIHGDMTTLDDQQALERLALQED